MLINLFGGFLRCLEGRQVSLGFERRHASHACRGHRLTVNVIRHVAGGKDAWEFGAGRARLVLEIAACFMSSCPTNSSVEGLWPMAMKTRRSEVRRLARHEVLQLADG